MPPLLSLAATSLHCNTSRSCRPCNATSVQRSKTGRVQSEKGGVGGGVTEDMLAKLKAAEAEAERLRRELQAAQGIEPSGAPAGRGAGRVDGADLRRETLFTAPSSPRNWLSENDVEFFTEDAGGGAGDAQAAAVVQRRLLLGLAATAGLGAFALVPTQDLSLSRPPKPLRAYLLPLLRAAALLDEAQGSVERGDGEELRAIVGRVLGFNALQSNLRSAAACLPDSRSVEAATALGREVYEAVLQIDPQEYFDTRTADGKVQARLAAFQVQALTAARASLGRFLALMPRDELEAARQAME